MEINKTISNKLTSILVRFFFTNNSINQILHHSKRFLDFFLYLFFF